MSVRAVAAAVFAAGAALAQAQSCADPPGKGEVRRAESSRYKVAYRIDPAPVVVSRHFALDLVVCPKDGAPRPDAVVVDAQMPAHRHGMNYRPGVKPVAPGSYRAEGLLFHMPGHWEFVFDIAGGGTRERAVSPYDLE